MGIQQFYLFQMIHLTPVSPEQSLLIATIDMLRHENILQNILLASFFKLFRKNS